MKLNKKLVLLSFCILGIGGLNSCKDFLDRKPLSQVAPEHYFTNAEQLGTFPMTYYSLFPKHSGWGIGVASYDNGTDNQAGASPNRGMFSLDEWKVPTEDGIGFGSIRNLNWFIETANKRIANGNVSGNKADIDHYMGEAYFFRAYVYFNQLIDYGDYPILSDVLTADDEKKLVENSKRQPRNEVAKYILSDLDKAISLLKSEMPMNQRISKKVALLFKSRVALYEATFEKYHRGSGRVPGDDKWPGKNKEWNKGKTFDIDAEINFFLTQAMESAKQCADMVPSITQNTHVIEPDISATQDAAPGWNPYYEMFTDKDLSKYPEVLLWAQYSKSKNMSHGVTNYLRKGTSSGWTRSLVNSFLTKNGLPIYADNSYAGDETLDKIKQNRDERLQLFMFSESTKLPQTPFRKFEAYKCPHFLNVAEVKDVTGFVQRKYYSYDPNEDINNELNGEAGCPVFRVVEAYLNYMEACYEKNGSLDATASEYWKSLRRRAGVDEDFNKTISATNMSKEANVNEPSYDWGAFSAGKAIDATLYNIRRERRCEFAGEGMRMRDLVRWRAMDQVKNYQIEGVNIWDKMYDYDYFKKDGKSIIISNGSEKANVSDKALGKYLRPYQVIKVNNDMYNGYTFYQAHYLSPFSYREMVLCSPNGDVKNSNLYQNPGWPTEADGKAME